MKSTTYCVSILIMCIYSSCNSRARNQYDIDRDSLTTNQNDTRTNDEIEQQIKDSLRTNIQSEVAKDVYEDTAGLYLAPIKILSASIVESEGGDYRNVTLKYKNISDKKIDGIKFRWKCVDVFGEPADVGSSLFKGYGQGFVDKEIKPNESRRATFEVLSNTAKKIVLVFPLEVAFDDGTKWKLNN